MTREIASGPSQVFGQLDNADLNFGKIVDDKGESKPLTHGNFVSFLNNRLQKIPGVERSRSFLILKMNKLSYRWGEEEPLSKESFSTQSSYARVTKG